MGKLLALLLCVLAIETFASREVRSPGGNGWQGNTNFGRSSSGFARSSVSGWAGSGSNLGRSSGFGGKSGWSGSQGSGGWGTSGIGSRTYEDNSNSGWGSTGWDEPSDWDNSPISRSNGWKNTGW